MMRLPLFLLALVAICAGCEAKSPRGGTPIPVGASTAGYTINTFHAGPFSTATVDQSLTYGAGFQWYYYNFFGQSPITPGFSTFNSDGTITIAGDFAAALGTAGQTGGSPPFVGIAFGCGAYYTAEISFSNQISLGDVVPSFYSFAIEHLVYPPGNAAQAWAGQVPPYDHFIEVDFLEFNRPQYEAPYTYGSDVHEYWGPQNHAPTLGCTGIHIGGGYCWTSLPILQSQIIIPKKTDNTEYHRYAKLWIPATVSTPGTLTTYYDDIPYAAQQISYTQFTSQSPPPATFPNQSLQDTVFQPWAYGVIDNQHHVPILLAGKTTPNASANPLGNSMRVRSVDVWQNSSACNITN